MSDSCGQPEKTAKNEMASGGRRRLLLALAAAPFAAFANTDPTAGLKRWGNGQFRRFGFLGADEVALKRWGEQMTRIFPNVKDGDFIIGEYVPGSARFYFNGRLLGEVADADFARLFFGIWLDAKTSAPELRAALLRRVG